VGKFLGVAGVLFLNAVVLSLGFLGILKFFAVDGGLFSPTLFEALFLLPLQACVLAALALFFASFSTPSLSILMTLGLYLVGVNLSHLRFLAQKAQDPVERAVLETLALVLPNFEHFNWGLRVSYGLPVPATYLATALSYAFIWIALLLMGAGMCLEGREN
jgi:ABC-type transport system involved in multi-copper enzyme maturation permease subunit